MARPIDAAERDVTQTRWWQTGRVDWPLIRSLSDDDLRWALVTSTTDEPGSAHFMAGLEALAELQSRSVEPYPEEG